MATTRTTSDRAPLVIGRRGASARAPENTIAAFEAALEDGADGIELDVQLSKDGHPVVIHDPTLDRTTDGAGPVRACTVRELKRLDAGGWFGRPFRGQRLQTLQEVLERFRGRTRFWIALRGASETDPAIEERVVSTVEIYEVLDRAVVESSDTAALGRAAGLNPEIMLGALIDRPPLTLERMSGGVARAVCPAAHLLGEPEVRAIRSAGLDCYVWKVDEPAQMDRLVGWDLSGIITGRPDLLRARLAG